MDQQPPNSSLHSKFSKSEEAHEPVELTPLLREEKRETGVVAASEMKMDHPSWGFITSFVGCVEAGFQNGAVIKDILGSVPKVSAI